MKIIPAIDIINGKCVRLKKGKFEEKKIYENDPLKVALSFQKAGLKNLHLIDLDGAKEGEVKNWKTIEKIVKNTDLLIDFGGGVNSQKKIKKLLDLGINQVIVGSMAIKKPEEFRRTLNKFGNDKIILSLDIRKGFFCHKGWQEEEKIDINLFLKNMIKMGLKIVMSTDVERDGMLKGPNFSLYKRLVSDFPQLKIIASGGVRDIEDLKKLSSLGLYGAIVGKAIYEKKVSLEELREVMPKRVIPCLDCKMEKGKWRVVKGIKFENLKLAGDPLNLAKKYEREEADQVAILDISASLENRKPFFDLIKKVSKAVKIPVIAGGGINSTSDIEKALNSGASKVSLNTAVVENPNFLNKATKKFGSKKIIVAIDVNGSKVCILGGTKTTKIDALSFAREMEKRGAGELLITSKDKDGTNSGYDISFLKKLRKNVSIPIVASGGAGKKEDFLEAITKAKVDAVLAAGVFHFNKIGVLELKRYLSKKVNISLNN